MTTTNDWHNIYITDKTGAKFFNTNASPMSTASEIKNISRHLELIKSKNKAYAFVDADSAVLMLDGIPYGVPQDTMSDDDLLAELLGYKVMTIIENANKAAEKFNEAMASLFPSYMAKAVASTNLGGALVIEFANVASVEDAPNKIIMNASGYMRFMMHLTDNKGKTLADGSPVEIELLNWSIPYKSEVLKYRKIKGKSPEEAMQKLFNWFEKNAEAIRSL